MVIISNIYKLNRHANTQTQSQNGTNKQMTERQKCEWNNGGWGEEWNNNGYKGQNTTMTERQWIWLCEIV